jgi:hypothetical protein
MRSVFFHLKGVPHQAVTEFLSALTPAVGPESWHWPPRSAEPALYVNFYEDLLAEAKPADLESLRAALGAMPSVSVMADVSGRVPGDVEVWDFAQLILNKFRGVAWDDYTTHCWTLAEIQSGVKIDGHTFSDSAGWHHDSDNRPVA